MNATKDITKWFTSIWNNNCEMNWNSNKGGTSFVLAHLSGGGTGSALDLLSIKSILFLCSVCNTKRLFYVFKLCSIACF